MEIIYNPINANCALDEIHLLVQILRVASHFDPVQKKEIASHLGAIELDIISGIQPSRLDFDALYVQLESCNLAKQQVQVLASYYM
jgi:hypothetical protein